MTLLHAVHTTPDGARARARERGFTLIEALIAAVLLIVGALGFASSLFTGHRLAVSVEERGLAAQTMQRVLERLRADPDWNGLYARLIALSRESSGDVGLTRLGADPAIATHPLTTYYADLVPPPTLGTVTALVQVPSTLMSAVADLRESAIAPRYGLPHDLNGDGVIDSHPRSGDYRSLPVVVRLRWQRSGHGAEEMVLATWLRGDR